MKALSKSLEIWDDIASQTLYLFNKAQTHKTIGDQDQAIACLDQAITIFNTTALTHDATQQTVEVYEAARRRLLDPRLLDDETINWLAQNTIVVMTSNKDQHDAWQQQLQSSVRQQLGQQGAADDSHEIAFIDALLKIISGSKDVSLPDDNPYQVNVKTVLDAIDSPSDATELASQLAQAVAAVMTVNQDQHGDQLQDIQSIRQQLSQQGLSDDSHEIAFIDALLKIMSGSKDVSLPDENPYQANVKTVLDSIANASDTQGDSDGESSSDGDSD